MKECIGVVLRRAVANSAFPTVSLATIGLNSSPSSKQRAARRREQGALRTVKNKKNLWLLSRRLSCFLGVTTCLLRILLRLFYFRSGSLRTSSLFGAMRREARRLLRSAVRCANLFLFLFLLLHPQGALVSYYIFNNSNCALMAVHLYRATQVSAGMLWKTTKVSALRMCVCPLPPETREPIASTAQLEGDFHTQMVCIKKTKILKCLLLRWSVDGCAGTWYQANRTPST